MSKSIQEDVVNKPPNYNTGKIDCIDASEQSMDEKEYAGYLKGNVVKYLWRYNYKGKPTEDLKKAAWYLDRLIEITEKERAVHD